MISHNDVDKWFTYQKPNPDQIERMIAVRESARTLAHRILEEVPVGPSQTLAIQRLREAVMRADLGIMLE